MGRVIMPPKNKKKTKTVENEISYDDDSDDQSTSNASNSDSGNDNDSCSDDETKIELSNKKQKGKGKIEVEVKVKDVNKDLKENTTKKTRKSYRDKELSNLISEQEEVVGLKKKEYLVLEKEISEIQDKLFEKSKSYKKVLSTYHKELEELNKLNKRSNEQRMEFVEKKIEKSLKAKNNPAGFNKPKLWPKKICDYVKISEESKLSFIEMKKLCWDTLNKEVGTDKSGFINTSKKHNSLELFGIEKGEKDINIINFATKLSSTTD